jgi:DNA-binding CsgD family transcriptional regulator/PAS domain-containing protein
MPDLVEQYSRFIGSIYDCVIEPSGWQAAIGAIADELVFCNAMMAVQAMPSGHPLLIVSSGVPDEWMPRMSAYGPAILELWGGPARMGQFPLDEPLVQSHQTSRASWAGNAWYTDFGVPQDIFDVVSIPFSREPTMIGSLGFGRKISAGEVSEDELVPLRLIAPHLRRAVAIGRLLDLKTVTTATFAATIDALAAGVILVDDRLRTIHANPAAQAMAGTGGALTLAGQRVALRGAEAMAALEAAVGLALRREAALGRRGIGIPSRDADGSCYVTHVLPLAMGDLRPGLSQSAVAALFVTPTLEQPQLPADALALLYDLTPAETRVLLAVARGESQAQVAASLGVLPSTVKTHLVHIFEKTGCSRQADLMRLVNSFSAPI